MESFNLQYYQLYNNAEEIPSVGNITEVLTDLLSAVITLEVENSGPYELFEWFNANHLTSSIHQSSRIWLAESLIT